MGQSRLHSASESVEESKPYGQLSFHTWTGRAFRPFCLNEGRHLGRIFEEEHECRGHRGSYSCLSLCHESQGEETETSRGLRFLNRGGAGVSLAVWNSGRITSQAPGLCGATLVDGDSGTMMQTENVFHCLTSNPLLLGCI